MIRKNGNFFKFVKKIREEEFHKSRKFEMLVESGGAFGTTKKKKYNVERNDKIREASILLEKGKISSTLFLNRMVYKENQIIKTFDEFEINDDDNDDICNNSDATEEESNSAHAANPSQIVDVVCSICLTNPSNILLLPCRHLKICNECQILLQSEALAQNQNNYLCPCCRVIVEDSIQVFN